MYTSNIWKSTVISSAKGSEKRVPFGVGCLLLFALLLPVNLSTVAFAQSPCPGIHVQILNIKNSAGKVACALFKSPAGFPTEYLRYATNLMAIKIMKAQARCDFEDIPPGTYAIAVVHDENLNGKLDTNVLGIPTEGFAFSNDAKGLFGPPSFSAASFPYDGRNIDLTISLHY
ncbi:MAG: DUF2141 domain-containing protein [Deltaproteobacteria bacterium]|nr:DUF2141 domain-containing protein [Deltaproteobacteria bacterium]TLN02050.1 MAG: DUF2141 domain-containing protein [bacterium]